MYWEIFVRLPMCVCCTRHFAISGHLIWLLQCLYHEQWGEVHGDSDRSRAFKIRAGVRQGCVLSPRLFCAVLEWARSSWKNLVGTAGFDLGDGLRRLLDLRFADDILLFTKSKEEAHYTLDLLIAALGEVGLIFNAEKTVIMTTEAQPPQHIVFSSGHQIQVLPRSASHRWLGGMLSAGGSPQQHEDVTHHVAAASKSFYANGWILRDRNVSLSKRLKFFDAVVSPVACFAAGHRTIHKPDLHRMDVEYKRLLRAVVGPPGNISWDDPWHETLHAWNNKVRNACHDSSLTNWREQSLASYWKLATYIANLPRDRLVIRVLERHRRRVQAGRQPSNWEDALMMYCRWRQLGNWKSAAVDSKWWLRQTDDFIHFVTKQRAAQLVVAFDCFTACALNGPPSGIRLDLDPQAGGKKVRGKKQCCSKADALITPTVLFSLHTLP